MSELTPAARDWLGTHDRVVLVTLRADGSPQSSNVLARFDGSDFAVSVTDSRAKTRNLRRDPRAVVHVLGDDFWSFASVRCEAELGAVSTDAGDAAGRDLLALYESLAGKNHPDPDEFLAAMADEGRLVLTLHPRSITGSGW